MPLDSEGRRNYPRIQRSRGINTRGAPRRKVAGRQRCKREDGARGGERGRVGGGDPIEYCRERLGGGKRDQETQHETDRGQRQSLPKHAPQNGPGRRAERHARADLARPLPHRIGHHAVDPD